MGVVRRRFREHRQGLAPEVGLITGTPAEPADRVAMVDMAGPQVGGAEEDKEVSGKSLERRAMTLLDIGIGDTTVIMTTGQRMSYHFTGSGFGNGGNGGCVPSDGGGGGGGGG